MQNLEKFETQHEKYMRIHENSALFLRKPYEEPPRMPPRPLPRPNSLRFFTPDSALVSRFVLRSCPGEHQICL